jgi:hypothetical protein
MDSPLPGIAGLIGFSVLNALMFGFGAAIQNLNETAMTRRMEAGDEKATRIIRIMNRPGAFIHTLQILSLLSGLIGGGLLLRASAAALSVHCAGFLSLPVSETLTELVLFLPVTALMVTLGSVVPKRLARRQPEKWAFRFVKAVELLMKLLLPLRVLVRLLSRLLLHLAGIDPDGREENLTEEDIMSMVNEGHEQGIVESDEAEMITNIFELNDKSAEDVMTHRKNVVALDCEQTLSEAVDFLLRKGRNSRFPVYREDIDNIIGVLHMKDAMICAHEKKHLNEKLSDIPGLLRSPHFIPESRALDRLFREMQSQKIHMAIVVDEYGQTAGIVTMEDILEEIVGNIVDEYDSEEETITALPDGSWIMSGMTHLDEAEEAAGIPFCAEEKENFDTLNGFLVARMDRIPNDGERLTVRSHGFDFHILRVQNKVIRSVKVVWSGDKG